MTNKEAIKRLEDLIGDIGNEITLDMMDYEALKLAIESLRDTTNTCTKRTCPIDNKECDKNGDCNNCAIKHLNDFLHNK